MKRVNNSLLIFLCMTAGSMAACDSSDDIGDDPSAGEALLEIVSPDEVAASGPVLEMEAPLVARIDGEAEGMIDFLDLSEIGKEDEILVVAVGSEGSGVTQVLDDGASPLELYLALAPDEAPPARLVEHHASLAANGLVPTTPRALEMWRENNVGSDCANGGFPSSWWESWRSGYGGTYNSGTYFSGYTPFSHGSAIVVSNTTKRALEACGYDHYSELDGVSIQTYSGGNWWQVYSYTQDPAEYYLPWGVATRSVSSSGTLSMRLVLSATNDSGPIHWIFWGGAYSS